MSNKTVKLICINTDNRPNDIPLTHWPKVGELYTVKDVAYLTRDNMLGVQFDEINLLELGLPYEFFAIIRFAILPEDIDAFKNICKASKDVQNIKSEDFNALVNNIRNV